MSYEILYDKQFIKLADNKFVPMIYSGSNNCYDVSYNGRDRRSRSWFLYGFPMVDNEPYASKEEFLKHCADYRQSIIDSNIATNKRYDEQGESGWKDEYSDDRFGYFTSLAIGGSTHTTSYSRYKGIFTTGCRKALTIEELAVEGITISITSYVWDKKSYDEIGAEPFNGTPTSAEEFISMYDEALEIFKDSNISIHISLNNASEHTMKRLRRKYFPIVRKSRDEKTKIEVDSYYTLVANNGSYFVRKLKYGYRYTHYPYLKFRTEKEAERRAKRSGAVVDKVEEKMTFYV